MRHFSLFISVCIILLNFSCDPEEEVLTFDQSAALTFSTDSVKFDTLFSAQQSITKRMRVYNPTDNAVLIKSISLAQKSASPFSVFVNGVPGHSFNDVKILGNDSLLILVEVTINPKDQNSPYLVTDDLEFLTNGNAQQVKLVAYGQDAVFINGEVLPCNTTWTADRPYVIYNSLLVDSLCTLTIEPGTRVYSHSGSFIFVEGTINAQGTADNRIIFTNDRFEEAYKDSPGQWGGLIFIPGSKSNLIEYADIRNAEFGVYLGTPDDDSEYDLTLGNVRIENMGGSEVFSGNIVNLTPGYGILAISSDLYAYNTLVNNCAINTVGNFAGGNYRYENCTFANYSFDFFRDDPSFVISNNLVLGDNNLLVEDLSAEIVNTIIWGSVSDELAFSDAGDAAFNLTIDHSLLRTSLNGLDVNNNILNKSPKFVDPRLYDYGLDTLSPAKDAGLQLGIISDINGNLRDNFPDIGAFERIEN